MATPLGTYAENFMGGGGEGGGRGARVERVGLSVRETKYVNRPQSDSTTICTDNCEKAIPVIKMLNKVRERKSAKVFR